MEDCKRAPSPFQSGAKISVTCTSQEVDSTLYRQLVGKLLYLIHTGPDLSFAVGLIARFMQNPHESQWKEAKKILRYVQGPITWACKKQSAISLSSAEAKYRGSIEASKEALWLHKILSEFGFQQQHPTTLWCDNQSAIQLSKDPIQHQCNKHIELHMHFIGKLIHDHVLEVQYCSIDDQVADIFTKALTEGTSSASKTYSMALLHSKVFHKNKTHFMIEKLFQSREASLGTIKVDCGGKVPSSTPSPANFPYSNSSLDLLNQRATGVTAMKPMKICSI
eukprot:PITA_30729